jgi:sucrose-phosphate synthase
VSSPEIATAGDSGNDRDMLAGQTAGIVVGNHDEELQSLKNTKFSRIYFADAHYAAGIIEGLRRWGLLKADQP